MSTETDLAFFFSAEQLEIAATLDRLLSERWPLENRRADLHPPRLWRDLAELGILGLPFPEAAGGLGGGPLDMVLVTETLGRHLAASPYVASTAVVSTLIGAADPALTGPLMSAASSCAVALDLSDPHSCGATYKQSGGGFVIDGSCVALFGPADAELVLVPARPAPTSVNAGPARVFLLSASRDASRIGKARTLDGLSSHLTLAGVPVERSACVGGECDATARIAAATDLMLLGYAAEAVGLGKALLQRTVDYVKVRKQFGVTVGSFQAIQHRLVEMFTAIEIASAQVQSTAAQFQHATEARRRGLAIATKMFADEAGRNIAREAVQLHGGMGLTSELDVGDFFKRLLTIRMIDGGRKAQKSSLLHLRNVSGPVHSSQWRGAETLL